MNADEQIRQDREILAAASKDSDDWDNATWAAWWRTAERHDPHFRRKVITAAAVAAEGALPVPVGDQPQPLDDGLAPEPIPARWDRTVILSEHPNGDLDGQTIVCCIADDGTKRPIGLFLDVEHREALGLLLVDPNGEDEQHTALLAEVQRLKVELASAQEDNAFLQRNTLPELRRAVEHHQAGKQRWRERAEKAEARVAELEAERHTTSEALTDAAETLRANRDRITELEENLRAVNAGWSVARARVAELERPAIEAKRNEIRSSYAETIAMAREDRDFEGTFNLECQLREREEQWKREDAHTPNPTAEEAK